MKTKNRVIAGVLMLTLSAGLMVGCSEKKQTAEEDGKVVITVGDCPSQETSPKDYETMVSKIEQF